jgi:ParB family chromosome partitioning protein
MTALHTVATLRVIPGPNARTDLGDLRELATSVKAKGVLQPITVEPRPGHPGWFVVVFGHRRLAAAKLAKLDEVPVILRDRVGADQRIEIQLIENLHREGMSPADKARAFGALRDRGYSAALISARTGVAPSTVSYYLRLLDLDDETLARVHDGDLPASKAVAAVREAHRETGRPGQLRASGRPAGKVRVAPHHFGPGHPLAGEAGRRCDLAHGGTCQKLPGGVACGEHWEEVLRADQDTRWAASAAQRSAAAGQGAAA